MGGILFAKFRRVILSVNEMTKERQRLLSLVLLTISFVIALFPYEQKIFGGLLTRSISISPNVISTSLGLVMLVPLYLRGIVKWNSSVFTTISFFLILGIFSSFVNLVVVGSGSGFFGTLNFYIVLVAVLLSWVGMRGVAGLAWVVVLIFGVYKLHSASVAIGFYGYLYLSCATAGLCFHSGLNPGELVDGVKAEYGGKAMLAINKVAEDIKTSANPSSM